MLSSKSSVMCKCGMDATRQLVNGEKVCEVCYVMIRNAIEEINQKFKKINL